MAERIQHPTTADVRERLDRIQESLDGIRAYLCLFDAIPDTGISERIVAAFREIQVDAGGGARCQQAVAAWATDLSSAVGADVAALPEAGDLLASESLWLATADAEDRQGVWWAGPQEDREDDTADRHDEWVEDWNSTVAELADRDDIRADHPFPIDPDEEAQW